MMGYVGQKPEVSTLTCAHEEMCEVSGTERVQSSKPGPHTP